MSVHNPGTVNGKLKKWLGLSHTTLFQPISNRGLLHVYTRWEEGATCWTFNEHATSRQKGSLRCMNATVSLYQVERKNSSKKLDLGKPTSASWRVERHEKGGGGWRFQLDRWFTTTISLYSFVLILLMFVIAGL